MERAAGFLLLAGLLMGSSIVTDAASEALADPTNTTNPTNTSVPATVLGSKVDQPVLQPSESVPPTGSYTLSPAGKPCLKITMGVEYIVMVNKKPFYYNVEPKSVHVTGYCNPKLAVLSLGFAGNSGSLVFTFVKEGNVSFVKTVSAHLTPIPCKGCATKTYPGVKDNAKLFLASSGRSFKCNSQTVFVMAEELHLKIVPLQVQAFNVPADGKFGELVECYADYLKRILPIIIGAAVVGLCLIAVLTYLIVRDRRRRLGYDRL